MSRRPTGKAVVVVAIGALVILVGAAGHVGWLFVIAAGVEGLVFGSLFIPHRLSSAVVSRTAPARAVAGEVVEVKLRIENHSKRSLPLMRIQDEHGAFPTATGVVSWLAPGKANEKVTIRSARRGVFEDGPTLLTSGAPFGFLISRQTFVVPTPIVVMPRSVELPALSLIQAGTSADPAAPHNARAGGGDEYVGVRPYRPGDSRRAIHWRSSARAGTIVVREFEERARGEVVLVLHGDDAGDPPDSAFEMLVSAAASVARHALDSGHRVHLTRSSPDGIRHITEPSVTQALDWLAAASPTDTELLPAVTAALGRSAPRAAVIVLTTTSGATPHEISVAFSAISTAGGSGSVVIARSASWSSELGDDADQIRAVKALGRPVRVLARTEDLRSCLVG
jgi:uncharacterized protein (DUF58 family)